MDGLINVVLSHGQTCLMLAKGSQREAKKVLLFVSVIVLKNEDLLKNLVGKKRKLFSLLLIQ